MLVKKLLPFKFLTAVLETVMAGVLLATSQAYPTLNNTSQTRCPPPYSASQWAAS
jgi:hypothetical protein